MHAHTKTLSYTHTQAHTHTHKHISIAMKAVVITYKEATKCKIYSLYNEEFRFNYKTKTLYSCLTFSNLLFELSENYKYHHLFDFIFHSLSL